MITANATAWIPSSTVLSEHPQSTRVAETPAVSDGAALNGGDGLLAERVGGKGSTRVGKGSRGEGADGSEGLPSTHGVSTEYQPERVPRVG